MDNAKKFVRLGADAGCAEARRRRPSQYQCRPTRRAGSAAGAEAQRDQADQLRLREIRLVGGAQAPAVQVGQRGEEPAEIVGSTSFGEAHPCPAKAHQCLRVGRSGIGLAGIFRMSRATLLDRTGLGRIALLPWYGSSALRHRPSPTTSAAGRFTDVEPGGFCRSSCRSGMALVPAVGRLQTRKAHGSSHRRLLGLGLIVCFQGFSIGLNGWTLDIA